MKLIERMSRVCRAVTIAKGGFNTVTHKLVCITYASLQYVRCRKLTNKYKTLNQKVCSNTDLQHISDVI